ncbi:MAG: F0F1 ATP synthase subunit alpha, partial [Chloroflexota bacterium]
QFASDLDKATRDQLNRGERISEVIKQPQFDPLPVERQVAILWVVTNGYLDDIETSRVRDFEEGFYRYLDTEQRELTGQLAEGAWDDDIIASLRTATDNFKQTFTA